MDQPEKNPLSTAKSETQTLCEFLASIRYESLPSDVVSRTEDFFLDWLGSGLAGKGSRPVLALEKFAQAMGPATGASEILTTRGRTSPFFAALINGAASHVVAELFKFRAGVNLTHVPYKGLGPALAEVAGGQINSVFTSIPAAMPLVKSGKLRVLGICSKQRTAVAPEVPTLDESGIKDFEAAIWYGYQAPAGLPKPILTKLSTEIVRVAQLADVRERFLGIGLDPIILMPEEFRLFIASEIRKWADVVKLANIKAE